MDDEQEPNPYQSPGAPTASPSAPAEAASKRIYLAWIAVFAMNLALPLVLGWVQTESGGRIGILVGTPLLFMIGCWLCSSHPSLSEALLVGGVAVGLAQAMPVLQIMAGMAGFFLVESVGLETSWPDAAIFIVTVTTGGLLMSAALATGLAIRALFAARRRS